MVKDFKITLSTVDEGKVFQPGQAVSGTLHFRLTEVKSYENVMVELYGGAEVRWTEILTNRPGQCRITYTALYQSKEAHVEKVTVLWDHEQSPVGTIGPGTYDLPFEFTLPSDCLGSFQGSYGCIKYVLRGHITSGQSYIDHTTELPVQVNGITDVNLPHLLLPAHQSRQKRVGFQSCCFVAGSTVELTANLTRTGIGIGDNLPLTVSVVNGSSRRIKIRASIQRHCTYHAQGRRRSERKKLVATVRPGIAPRSQDTWNVEDLVVPMPLEPSFEGLAIIKMQYVVKVTALIPWARNSSVTIPITLGNVTFNNAKSIT